MLWYAKITFKEYLELIVKSNSYFLEYAKEGLKVVTFYPGLSVVVFWINLNDKES